MDSTVRRATGGVWHKQDRAANVVPHTSIDPEAHRTGSGWRGWVDGGKPHLVTAVAGVWLPLAAELTPANAAANAVAPLLLADLPAEGRFVRGDRHENAPNVRALCGQDGRILVASRRGGYPHTGDSVAVRRAYHKRRSAAIEHFNQPFEAIFDAHGTVPTRGLVATKRVALGAVLVGQLLLWHRHAHGLDLRIGRKPCRKAT